MPSPPDSNPQQRPIDLGRERLALRRSLARSTAAAVLVLLVAVGLAVAAALAATRAKRSQAEATENLWAALSAEAGAGGGGPTATGTKARTLDAIAAAAAIRPSPELRDRAIAALARTDLRHLQRFENLLGSPIERIKGSAFTPDYRRYFAGSEAGAVTEFDMATGSPGRTFVPDPPPRAGGPADFVFVSPDARFLAARLRDGAAIVWDTATGEELLRDDQARLFTGLGSIAFHPRRPEWIAVARQRAEEVRVFDLVAGGSVAKLQTDGTPVSMQFSADGERLALRVGQEVQLLDWQAASPSASARFDPPGDVNEFAWHPDGTRIAAASSDSNFYLYSTGDGSLLRSVRSHDNFVHYLSFVGEGDMLLSNSWDSTVRLHDTESGQQLAAVWGLFLNPASADGTRVGGPTHANLDLFEIDRSRVWRPLAGSIDDATDPMYAPSFSADGRWLAAGGGPGVAIWDVASGALLAERADLGWVTAAAFTPAADALIVTTETGGAARHPLAAGADGTLVLGEAEPLPAPPTAGNGPAALGAGGRWLGFGGEGDGRAIDLADPARVAIAIPSLPWENNRQIALSPDGSLAAFSGWRTPSATVWHTGTSEQVAELPGFGGAAAFSPDGSVLAVMSKEEIVFWETAGWSRLAATPRPMDTASFCFGLAWSRCGRFLAAGGEGGAVQLLDASPTGLGRQLATLVAPLPDRVYGVGFSPDGRHLAAACNGGRCHLWDLDELARDLRGRGLHWGGTGAARDGRGAGSGDGGAAPGGAVLLAGSGIAAALVFGLFTLLYQRGLMRRFAAAESLADERAAELRSAESQLADSAKMRALGTLSAGVAHDFKNLLSVIRLSNDLIRRDAGADESVREETEAIAKAVAQGDGVVKAMLGYSRGAEGEVGAAGSGVDPGDVVEGLVGLLGQQFLSGIRLRLDVARGLPHAAVPRGALEQVLLNLIVNASEAMGGRGTLAITVGQAAGPLRDAVLEPPAGPPHIAVTVADDGPGIDAATAARVFEPFFTTKTVGADKGTGLGLATVYRIAEDNGLGLALRSEPGAGTEFELRLPAAA